MSRASEISEMLQNFPVKVSWNKKLNNSACSFCKVSLFGNLVRTDGTTKSDLDFRELSIFSYKNLVDKEEIGVGAFAVVFTAKLPDKSKVVVKKVISADEETKNLLLKKRDIAPKPSPC